MLIDIKLGYIPEKALYYIIICVSTVFLGNILLDKRFIEVKSYI